MKDMRLQDMTKEELVRLIQEHSFLTIRPKDLLMCRYRTLHERGRKLMEESLQCQERLKDITDPRKRKTERRRLEDMFDEGDELCERADKYFEAWRETGE